MLKIIAATCTAAAMLGGCAVIRFADGERVAIEHETADPHDLQVKADQACKASGGHVPATLVSNLQVNPALPAGMSRMVATFRCS